MPLEAKHISFRYESDGPWILRDRSLTLERGERVALFAPSGYGKTTLAKLLAGYLQPTEGQILLDGHPIHKIRRADLRRALTMVLSTVTRHLPCTCNV